MFGLLLMSLVSFVIVAGVLIFIDNFMAMIAFLVITMLFLFSINKLTDATKYLYGKALDPCYRTDNVRYIGKGPWQYELPDRVCIGRRDGNVITYETGE
jgi:hypothetical protein